ncbi:MAG: threonine/serine exporter family protein [Streptococcaceae bacterium]|jgi:uncharacterized membrane protein YjjP (DUF1212 family)|nr:threonine/serine exporter family protein [Streptococcaceae bacterium]
MEWLTTDLSHQDPAKQIPAHHLLMASCLLAGKILMANGSEIARVEDVILRIGRAEKIDNLQVYALLNGITISFPDQGLTQMQSIPPRNQTMDMEKIVAVNDLTRQFTAHTISLESFHDSLSQVDTTISTFPKWLQVLGAVFVSLTSMVMLTKNSVPINLLLTAGASGLAYTIYLEVRNRYYMRFFGLFLASLTISFLMLVCSKILRYPFEPDIVIIGAVMPFVPGVALTNAVREIIAGSFISGQGRIVEALLTALSVGLGIALLSFFY